MANNIILNSILNGKIFHGSGGYTIDTVYVSFKKIDLMASKVNKVINYVCAVNPNMPTFQKWRQMDGTNDNFTKIYEGKYKIKLYVNDSKLCWMMLKSSGVNLFEIRADEAITAITEVKNSSTSSFIKSVLDYNNDGLPGDTLVVIDIARPEHLKVITDTVKKINPNEYASDSWFFTDGKYQNNRRGYYYEIVCKLSVLPKDVGEDYYDAIELSKSYSGALQWNLTKKAKAIKDNISIVSSYDFTEVIDYELKYHKITKKQTIEKTTKIKEEVKPMSKFVKVFYKGKAGTKAAVCATSETTDVVPKSTKPTGVNIRGIVHQFAKGARDSRPFVQKLLIDELDNVITEVLKFKTEKHLAAAIKANDIMAIDIFKQISVLSYETKKMLDKKDGSEKNVTVAPAKAVVFYKAEALAARKKKPKYDWINSYLTHEVVNNQTPTILFESKYIKILIDNGVAIMHDTNKRTGEVTTYEAVISYSVSTNSFSL